MSFFYTFDIRSSYLPPMVSPLTLRGAQFEMNYFYEICPHAKYLLHDVGINRYIWRYKSL